MGRKKIENPIVKHPLYSTWDNMKGRCLSKTNKSYHNYGGRGIFICERWLTFRTFAEDMGHKPHGMTLERRDNDGPYSPDNCFWETRKRQARNRRDTVWLVISGVRHAAADLAEIAGVSVHTVVNRHKAGLPYEKIVASTKTDDGRSHKKVSFKTHCTKGHELTESNKIKRADSDSYKCRECERLRGIANRLKAKSAT